jgi:hypothetical protein
MPVNHMPVVVLSFAIVLLVIGATGIILERRNPQSRKQIRITGYVLVGLALTIGVFLI